jgi:hypothetical protein
MILASGRVREQLRSWEVPGDANWDIYIYIIIIQSYI